MKKLFIFLVSLLLSMPAYSQGLFTLTGWELEEIPVTGGEGKTAVAGYRIQYSSDFVAAVEFIDASSDTTTVFVRPDDSALELPLRAYPSCAMIDCPYFRQIGSTIYYRNQLNEVRALVINPNDTYTDNFFTNADQIAINQNGEMVIIYGNSVNYRETDGTLHSLDESYNSSYLDLTYPINANASNKKFVFEWGNGFMVGTITDTHGDFQKWFMKNGSLNGMPAKQNAYYNWVTDPMHNPFYKTYVNEPSGASLCYIRELSSNEVLICAYSVYSLGDESADTEKFTYPVSMTQYSFKLAASNTKLYASSNYSDGRPKGLYRMELFGVVATQLNSGNNITQLLAYTIDGHDTVIFCGTRYSDSIPVIVQIDNAESESRTVTEVESSCNSLTPLH
jgi:hypothetical protein